MRTPSSEGARENSSYRSPTSEGKGADGIEKTPAWASEITGVPAERIRQLAREIAAAKPCSITQGWGPQRHANGENNARAILMLVAAYRQRRHPWWWHRCPRGRAGATTQQAVLQRSEPVVQDHLRVRLA